MSIRGYLEAGPEPLITSNILDTLQAAETNPEIHRKVNYYMMRDAYRAKGLDLDAMYSARPTSRKREGIQNQFMRNDKGAPSASLAEVLPLYANTEGRLGDYIESRVTKTLKQDDQGNSFIDLVIELKNTWIANGAPAELQDVPEKMTFLVDVTVDGDSERFDNKIVALKEEHLLPGRKASVLGYADAYGNLGVERPKLLVKQDGKRLAVLGSRLGECITRHAADRFTISKPGSFNAMYREYFLNLMLAVRENALFNIAYMKSLVPDPRRTALIKEYEKIVKFVDVYKKTPATKSRNA